jgi:RNA polymerase sigma-70 factor (ECF subfamily)
MYWEPLYGYLRRRGYDPEAACDLVQGFFSQFLEKNYFRGLDPKRGRFRSYLLSALHHHLSDQRDRDRALKRGGGEIMLSLETEAAERRYRALAVDQLTPELLYERGCALALLRRVMARLETEYAETGRGALFSRIRGLLTGSDGAPFYRDLGADLGMSEDAVKQAVHRMRTRYRQRLRGEIAETVASHEQVEDEIRYLLSVLQ